MRHLDSIKAFWELTKQTLLTGKNARKFTNVTATSHRNQSALCKHFRTTAHRMRSLSLDGHTLQN